MFGLAREGHWRAFDCDLDFPSIDLQIYWLRHPYFKELEQVTAGADDLPFTAYFAQPPEQKLPGLFTSGFSLIQPAKTGL